MIPTPRNGAHTQMLWLVLLGLPRLCPSATSFLGASMEGKMDRISGGYDAATAHCTSPGEAYRIQAGQLRLYHHDHLVKVKLVVPHPKFTRSWSAEAGADIALMKLQVPLRLSASINVVSLPNAGLRVKPRTLCWVTGWGFTKDGPLDHPYRLQEAAVPVVDKVVCEWHYQDLFPNVTETLIKKDMVCAGNKDQDACQGDSGGPLVCYLTGNWVQVGIVSWGNICGQLSVPGVYTKVASYVSWIHQFL
ncbi:mastin-like [Sorex fumeus]|uniref:mastin-like n=1 Tax=Sorex fumeus TaxID=62283 RepID=UPI0024AD7C42|nr:mastin-like [Sorex fumeus]